MKLPRRRFLHLAAGAVALPAVSRIARGASLSGARSAYRRRRARRRLPRHRRACTWQGLGAPKNTPIEIVDRLNTEINAGLADPKVKARFAETGAATFIGSPSSFGKFMAEETEKWAEVITFANIKVE